jgi:hypothetical protein
MSKSCNTCHRNAITGEWKSCDEDCPVFGKYFDELAKMVIDNTIRNPSISFEKLNNPTKEVIEARKKTFESCDKLITTETNDGYLLEVDGFN